MPDVFIINYEFESMTVKTAKAAYVVGQALAKTGDYSAVWVSVPESGDLQRIIPWESLKQMADLS